MTELVFSHPQLTISDPEVSEIPEIVEKSLQMTRKSMATDNLSEDTVQALLTVVRRYPHCVGT